MAKTMTGGGTDHKNRFLRRAANLRILTELVSLGLIVSLVFLSVLLTSASLLRREVPCLAGTGCTALFALPVANPFGIPISLLGAVWSVVLLFLVGTNHSLISALAPGLSRKMIVIGAVISLLLQTYMVAATPYTCMLCSFSAAGYCLLAFLQLGECRPTMSILDNTAKWAKVSILLLPIAIGFMTASLARKLETPPSHDPEVLKLISTDELIGVARHSRRAVGDEYIIMFGDPFCPACAGAIKDVIRKGLPNITFVYRHYPLESHPDSLMASVRLETLSNDSFWLALAEVHDKKASVLREVEEIAREYDSGSSISPEVARRLVESDYRVAKALRLPGTPFFVYLNRRTGLKRVLWLGEFRRDYLE